VVVVVAVVVLAVLVVAMVVLTVVVMAVVVVLAVVVVVAVGVLAVVVMKVQDREVQRSVYHTYTPHGASLPKRSPSYGKHWPQDTSTRSPNKVVFMSCLEPEDHQKTVTELLKSQHTRGDY